MVATLLAIFSQFSSEVMANRERTFIMVKPDGVHRGLVGEIMKRFEQKGFKLVAIKFVQVSACWVRGMETGQGIKDGEHDGSQGRGATWVTAGPCHSFMWLIIYLILHVHLEFTSHSNTSHFVLNENAINIHWLSCACHVPCHVHHCMSIVMQVQWSEIFGMSCIVTL